MERTATIVLSCSESCSLAVATQLASYGADAEAAGSPPPTSASSHFAKELEKHHFLLTQGKPLIVNWAKIETTAILGQKWSILWCKTLFFCRLYTNCHKSRKIDDLVSWELSYVTKHNSFQLHLPCHTLFWQPISSITIANLYKVEQGRSPKTTAHQDPLARDNSKCSQNSELTIKSTLWEKLRLVWKRLADYILPVRERAKTRNLSVPTHLKHTA